MQPALRIVIAQVQRPQTVAAAAWRGPSEDDEFFAPAALHLQPAMSASGAIRPVSLFADDAFQSHATRLALHRGGVAELVIAVSQHALPAVEVGQDALAIQQLAGPQVPAIEMQQIEQVKLQRGPCLRTTLPAARESSMRLACRSPPARHPPGRFPPAALRSPVPRRAAGRSNPARCES